MQINVFKRYEKKYLVTEEQLIKMMPEINRHMLPDEYSLDGKKYSIYNIYYDTENYDLIRRSMERQYYKEKFRLRAYEPFSAMDNKIFMEIKKKIGGVVSKRRTTVSLQEAIAFVNDGIRPHADSRMENQVLDEMEYFMSINKLTRGLFISYERMAFFGRTDSSLRLTFDSKINARKEDIFSSDMSGNTPLLDDGKYIMEIKVSESIPLWIAELMSELGIRRVKFSKYGTAYSMGICGRNV